MSDSTTNSVSFPVPNIDDERKLPLIIADYCGFPLAYHEVEGELYFSVQDWIRGVAQTDEPRKFWDAMKRRLKKAGYQVSSWCRQLPYTAENGKKYKMDHATHSALYQITQRMDANTGLRDLILTYLADTGVEFDDMRLDPDKALEIAIEGYRRQGKSERWITARVTGKIKRAKFTAALKNAVYEYLSTYHYAAATDDIYMGLWERTSAQLKTELNLPANANLRDNQPMLALTYQGLAEEVASQKLGDRPVLSWREAKSIVQQVARLIGVQAQATSKYLNMDIATGKPLLPEKTL
jgi:hypothetical protein